MLWFIFALITGRMYESYIERFGMTFWGIDFKGCYMLVFNAQNDKITIVFDFNIFFTFQIPFGWPSSDNRKWSFEAQHNIQRQAKPYLDGPTVQKQSFWKYYPIQLYFSIIRYLLRIFIWDLNIRAVNKICYLYVKKQYS